MKAENTFLSRHARFLWLFALLLTPATAFLVYDLTPHDAVWHDVVYSLFCLPLFAIFLITLIGSILSFLLHRTMSKA